MRYSENFSEKLNNLLNMNYEVEKIYFEAFNSVTNETLKRFFREGQFKRNEFSRALRDEIAKHNIAPKSVNVLSKYYYKAQMNFKNNIILNNENNLLDEVFRLKRASIDMYDELLREINLPFSLCKTLVKQRDHIQATMRVLERNKVFVA